MLRLALISVLALPAAAQPFPDLPPVTTKDAGGAGAVAAPVPLLVPGAEFAGLSEGRSADASVRARVLRVKRILADWNPRLPLTMDGTYDVDGLGASLALFKAVYGTGSDGSSIDAETARLLAARENGGWSREMARRFPDGRKASAGRVLYSASLRLGLPYLLGADGVSSMDCGLLTKKALYEAGVVDEEFTRAADYQYLAAVRGEAPLTAFRAGEARPRPGDLVFFQWTYVPRAGPPVYAGITHVGLWVGTGAGPGDAFILAASSSRGVSLQRVSSAGAVPYAFARPR